MFLSEILNKVNACQLEANLKDGRGMIFLNAFHLDGNGVLSYTVPASHNPLFRVISKERLNYFKIRVMVNLLNNALDQLCVAIRKNDVNIIGDSKSDFYTLFISDSIDPLKLKNIGLYEIVTLLNSYQTGLRLRADERDNEYENTGHLAENCANLSWLLSDKKHEVKSYTITKYGEKVPRVLFVVEEKD